ncbi:hypothetical protein PB1A_0752 [Leuconostoc inhae]|uniref:Uncharacterized protein n=2 Tax=Leuconostoc TaxID=1243 RepID=A0AAN2UH78_9LACO|nr:conserved hypothetical protein [Leuconostoc gasicomitatum LMG 18811]CUW03627.1 hypothetical protein KSL4_0893 [Leuconostoc inhae]CUW13246.1 hypothetical protein C122C_1035 [Leuconostoc gasicomitatum]CUW04276.1 hypothetical protein PB1A_0752 [Leuconostoc inhae]CUW15518.1 hypothetical protein PL111_1709 [Leuconostoc inhae]
MVNATTPLTFGAIKVPFSSEMYNGLSQKYLAEPVISYLF